MGHRGDFRTGPAIRIHQRVGTVDTSSLHASINSAREDTRRLSTCLRKVSAAKPRERGLGLRKSIKPDSAAVYWYRIADHSIAWDFSVVVIVLPLTSIEKFDPFFPTPNIKAGKSPLHESVNTSTLHIQTDFLLASSAPALRRFELSIMLAIAASFTASSRTQTFEYNLPKSPPILLLHF